MTSSLIDIHVGSADASISCAPTIVFAMNKGSDEVQMPGSTVVFFVRGQGRSIFRHKWVSTGLALAMIHPTHPAEYRTGADDSYGERSLTPLCRPSQSRC